MSDMICRSDSVLSVGDSIDKAKLKKMQDRFCAISNMFAFCMDEKGCMLTEMSGSDADVRRLLDHLSQDAFFRAHERVSGESLEDQIVEETDFDNVKIAAINVRLRGKSALTWGVCAVLKEPEAETGTENTETGEKKTAPEGRILTGISRQIEEKNLYYALDLLRMVTKSILEARYPDVNPGQQKLCRTAEQKELSDARERVDALAESILLLGSDEPAEVLFMKQLQIAGEYLGISSAQIFKLSPDGESMDVVAEWYQQGIISVFEKTRNIKRSPLLNGDKPVIVSSDTECSPIESRLQEEAHIIARATFPLLVNGQVEMYVSFHECKTRRHWNADEIQFMSNIVCAIQSILVKRVQKNSLVSAYASLEAILDHVGAAVYVKDQENGTILFVNKILKENFEQELREGTLDKLLTDGMRFADMKMQPSDVNQEMNRELYQSSKSRFYDLYMTVITWVDGRKAVLYAAYDITEKKECQKIIEKQSYTDYLTGLYNRMCCERDLAVQIDYAKKNNRRGAILYLDLDDFKHINDGLGHQYGDVLLKAIAHSVQRIEGIQNTCYRMGGDEFVIIIPVEIYPRLKYIVEEIKAIFDKPWFLKDADYYCTMSMGVVEFPNEGEGVQDLIKKADIAMYEAKSSGKNRVAQYTDKLSSDSNRRLDMEKNMRDATSQGYRGFEVYYQPIVDIQAEGEPCIGAEALVRWNSDELGFISPAVFIPLAEYLGLINPIGNFVLREACKTLREWNDHGYPTYKINVNLSVVQLLQNDIVESIEEVIRETGINPGNLTLEVTESLAINDMEKMKNILGRIKALGVRIALDDFGTGYSSLNHIREMPLDVIKVDQTFVRDLDKDSYSQAFIKMVAELAESIGVSVCVEGIERKEQLEVLEGMKVKMIQGFYFGKPMNRSSFDEKFAPVIQIWKTQLEKGNAYATVEGTGTV